MNVYAIIAALGTLVVAGPAFFIFGRSRGTSTEHQRQVDAKATAEETSRRIVGEAERDADNLRKTAVVTGKEEVIRLRESFEQEDRKSTRLNSSHVEISYAVFCLKKK